MKMSLKIIIAVLVTILLVYVVRNTLIKQPTTPVVPPVYARYCPDSKITIYKDKEGKLGMFSVVRTLDGKPMRDSSVSWFDASGAAIGTFHIFGDENQNTQTMKKVNELMVSFSIIEDYNCH